MNQQSAYLVLIVFMHSWRSVRGTAVFSGRLRLYASTASFQTFFCDSFSYDSSTPFGTRVHDKYREGYQALIPFANSNDFHERFHIKREFSSNALVTSSIVTGCARNTDACGSSTVR